MIYGDRWKIELGKLSRSISIWSHISWLDEYAKHRLAKAVLYSTVVIRKVIEDLRDVEKKLPSDLPQMKILHAEVEAIVCLFEGEKGWSVRGRVCVSDYGKAEKIKLKAVDVCNGIIHSYYWDIANYQGSKSYAGFLVASDRNKEKNLHFVSFDEWNKFIQLVIDEGRF